MKKYIITVFMFSLAFMNAQTQETDTTSNAGLIDGSGKYTIKNLEINTQNSDFGPSQGMRRRSGNLGVG